MMQVTQDSSELICRHVAHTTFSDLPENVVTAVKLSMVDTLACVFAGTMGEEVASIASLAADWGGRPSSTIIGGGGIKVPPDNAVLVNGAAVHQYDFDDTHDKAVCHPTAASLIPALALAQEVGTVSGQELITAIAMGNEVTVRVALAIKGKVTDYPWIRATVAGIFGAAAASAKILSATEAQHRHALGLALPQAAVTLASMHHAGSSVRSIRDGLAYRNGVLAAELAVRGVRGDGGVFDGPYGLYQSYFRGEYEREVLVQGLGEKYHAAGISLKPWPSCRHLHGTLTATLELLEQNDLALEGIDHILVHVGDINLDRCRPVSVGMVPLNRIDLLCNLPFAVAAALRYRKLPLNLYRDPVQADDVILNAVPKVKWIHDRSQNGAWTLEPGLVEIRTSAGKVLRQNASVALGHPDNPMSLSRMKAKLLECAAAAARPVSDARANEIFETVMRLDDLQDIRPLTTLLE